MRTESKQLEKTMQNRHLSVSTFVDDQLMHATKNANNCVGSKENHNTSMEGECLNFYFFIFFIYLHLRILV